MDNMPQLPQLPQFPTTTTKETSKLESTIRCQSVDPVMFEPWTFPKITEDPNQVDPTPPKARVSRKSLRRTYGIFGDSDEKQSQWVLLWNLLVPSIDLADSDNKTTLMKWRQWKIAVQILNDILALVAMTPIQGEQACELRADIMSFVQFCQSLKPPRASHPPNQRNTKDTYNTLFTILPDPCKLALDFLRGLLGCYQKLQLGDHPELFRNKVRAYVLYISIAYVREKVLKKSSASTATTTSISTPIAKDTLSIISPSLTALTSTHPQIVQALPPPPLASVPKILVRMFITQPPIQMQIVSIDLTSNIDTLRVNLSQAWSAYAQVLVKDTLRFAILQRNRNVAASLGGWWTMLKPGMSASVIVNVITNVGWRELVNDALDLKEPEDTDIQLGLQLDFV